MDIEKRIFDLEKEVGRLRIEGYDKDREINNLYVYLFCMGLGWLLMGMVVWSAL